MNLDSPYLRTSTTEQMAGQIAVAKEMQQNPSLYENSRYGYGWIAKELSAEVQKDTDDDRSLEALVELRKHATELDAEDRAALDTVIDEQLYYEIRDELMALPGKELQEILEARPEIYAHYFAQEF